MAFKVAGLVLTLLMIESVVGHFCGLPRRPCCGGGLYPYPVQHLQQYGHTQIGQHPQRPQANRQNVPAKKDDELTLTIALPLGKLQKNVQQQVYRHRQVGYHQPQVVYQQPQVVYQQPQVVYQQPQIVQQQESSCGCSRK